jgi:hypothetical protein
MDEEGITGAIRKLEDFRLHIEAMVQNTPALQISQTT